MRVVTILFLLHCLPALAWWDLGHRVVAEVASQRVKQSTLLQIEHLLQFHPDPQVRTLDAASNWADEIRDRSHPFHHYHRSDWHYQGVGGAKKQGALKTQLAHQWKLMCDVEAPQAARAVALSWVVHLVGDIHQPLHVGALCNAEFPEGDRGGNDYFVWLGDQRLSLHVVWDSAGCRFLRPISENRFRAYTNYCSALAPANVPTEPDFELWLEEALELCTTRVYAQIEPDTQITSEYLGVAIETTQERLTLAGIRLASLLDQAFERRL